MQLEGSCHCGRVRFRLQSAHPCPFNLCYCSICRKTAGGGGFAMVHTGDGATTLFDFFAQTPLAETGKAEFFEVFADFGEKKQAFHIGHGSTATPGFVPGLFHLHARHASLAMAELLRAAEAAARAAEEAGHAPPVVLAVTVLTSHDDEELAAIGLEGPCGPAVLRLAAMARDAGAGGLVCSAQEVAAGRELRREVS